MTDRLWIGILLAVVIECAHWTRLRWDFNEETCSRAWQVNAILIGLVTILIFLDGPPLMALPNLLTWLPALLLPMQFVQSYGMKNSLPLNTFSFLAKHRRKRNLRLGLTEAVIQINFGNVYFVAALVGSTLGNQANSWPFLPGIIVLTGWMLLSTSRSRPLSMIVALTIAGGIALAGQVGLDQLENWFYNSAPGPSQFNPNTVSTMIGRHGIVDLPPDIVWRLRPQEKTPPPSLLRTATYNTFRGATWQNQRVAIMDFKDLTTIGSANGEIYHLLRENLLPEEQQQAIRPGLPRFSLRGAASAETPLPLPGDAASLREFELDAVECNSFGTVRVFPKHSVIEGTVLWKGATNPESPPISKEDLEIPPLERDTLEAVSASLHLADKASLQEKLGTIRAWFLENFRYTRNLTIYSSPYVSTSPTAITRFLTKSRAGHCEYFATATILLLRDAGIPARYATGYAVIERDVKHREYVIRGTHGHAWCRVWDGDAGKWIDFDTTPGSWMGSASPQDSATQRFSDTVKRLREDFFLWRNRPANRSAATLIMSLIGLGVGGFVVQRLWKSKRRLEVLKQSNNYGGPVTRTPLNAIEKKAERRLGTRPSGEPLGAWLLRLRPLLPDSATLTEAVALHQRLRFDPAPPQQTEQERLAELAGALEAAIKRG